MTTTATGPAAENDEQPGRGERTTRRRGVVVTVIVMIVLVAAGAAALNFGGRFGAEDQARASTLPPATAIVEKRTLSDTETAEGELGYGSTRTVNAKVGGTITALAATGSTVARGKALYRLDNKPVTLLFGTMPAYRTMSEGVEGRDVEQLEENLRALGYRGFTVDDDFTDATAEAVERWQDDLGRNETGRVEPADIHFARTAVRIDSQSAELGAVVRSGSAVVSYTGSDRVVTVLLDVDDQRLAKKGASVTIGLPDGTETPGEISAVETVIEASSGGNGEQSAETKIEVTVAADDDRALAEYDSASVDVEFTASQRKDVLTVPVAALLALSEGGYGVEVVDGSVTRIVAVRTGLFADGQVEVSGEGISDGTVVGVAG